MATLTKADIGAVTWYAVGYGTEAGYTPTQLVVCTNLLSNGGYQGTVKANSGYSLGVYQFDFGQRGAKPLPGGTDGTTGSAGTTAGLADINLAADTFHRSFTDSIPLTAETETLPDMQGSTPSTTRSSNKQGKAKTPSIPRSTTPSASTSRTSPRLVRSQLTDIGELQHDYHQNDFEPQHRYQPNSLSGDNPNDLRRRTYSRRIDS